MQTPAAFINIFEKKLSTFFDDYQNNTHLIQSAKYICLSPKSKRVRPYLVYIFSNYFQVEQEFALDVAFVAELVHTASLLHDDILDDADKRRGKETVHSIYNVPTAVLTGDWLYAKSLSVIRDYDIQIYKNIVDVSAEMSAAVALEYELRNRADWNLSHWLEIAEGKTGNLFAWSGESIFKIKNPTIKSKDFFYACLLFGIVFQILDDVKDFVSVRDTKKAYKDLINGNMNFVLVQALLEFSNFSTELQKFFALEENKKEKSIETILYFTFSNKVIDRVVDIIQQALNMSYSLFENYSCTKIYSYLQKWLSTFCKNIHWNPIIDKVTIKKIFDSLNIKKNSVGKDNIFLKNID